MQQPWSRRGLGVVGAFVWAGLACGDDDRVGVEPSPVVSGPMAPDAQPPDAVPPDASDPDELDGSALPPGQAERCGPPLGAAQPLVLTPIVTGMIEPLYVTVAPGDDSRLFIVEQAGRIRILKDGQLLPEPFLDISSRVTEFHSEDGLLGLAFHPDYANNGRFFVHYSTEQVGRAPGEGGTDAGQGAADGDDDAGATDSGAAAPPVQSADAGNGLFIPSSSSVISEFVRGSDADHALADSERRLIVVEQLFFNHNAGMLEFDRNGLLFVALGDGDGTGDPNQQAQNLSVLTGKLLRIDVDQTSPGGPYGIPAGNMLGDGVRPEIWNYGLRNPWRFSFDSCNGDLYIGDVGQGRVEEIDYEPGNAAAGRNYGWSVVEGDQCFRPRPGCSTAGFQTPVLTYVHPEGCSVTGGYVYRGLKMPWLRGTYFYADYCAGSIGSFRMQDGALTELTDRTSDLNPDGITGINSFGVDHAGELYVVTNAGSIYRIDPE